MTCARCGTQNPDGNRFCVSCGTPLVPAAAQAPAAPVGVGAANPPWLAGSPPAPAAAYAAMPQQQPQAAYQTPYYAPQPGQSGPVVHRTPWAVIIAIVVVMILVLSGVGTVLALSLGHKSNPQATALSSASSPSPSAGQTPSPSASPVTGQKVSNSSETVVVPSGWKVVNKDGRSITIQSPRGDGTLTVASGPFSPPQNAQQIRDQIDKQLAAKFPDAGACPGSSTDNGAIAGVNGIFWTECFTLTSGGQTVTVGEPLWAGANATGSVGYVIVLQTTQDNLTSFVKSCVPILQSGITWKLK